MQKEHVGFLFGMLAAISSSVGALLVKATMEVNNELLVFARFSVCLAFFLPQILRGKISFSFDKTYREHWIRSLAGLGSVYCYFYSVERLPLVNAITLSNTFVLFLPLVVFFAKRFVIPKTRILAICIGFVGIVLILRPTQSFSEVSSLVGLVGGILSAIAIFGVRQLAKKENPETILAHYFLISTAISFFPMIFRWEPVEHPALWINLLLIGLLSLCFQYCMTLSLAKAPATRVSTLNYFNVLFSGIFGWWFFGEVPTWWVLAGSLLIVLGGLISIFSTEPLSK